MNKITWNKIHKLILLPNVEYDEYASIKEILADIEIKIKKRFRN